MILREYVPALWLAASVSLAFACRPVQSDSQSAVQNTHAPIPAEAESLPRVIAIGDLHGDVNAARRA